MQQDTPQVAKRRAREEKTISQMVALYCAGNHEPASRTETAICGEAVMTPLLSDNFLPFSYFYFPYSFLIKSLLLRL